MGEMVSQALACSEPPMMASRVFLSTSCLLSIRRSSKDSRPWRRRSREEPWLSWQSFSTTGSTWPMSVSRLPVPRPGSGKEGHLRIQESFGQSACSPDTEDLQRKCPEAAGRFPLLHMISRSQPRVFEGPARRQASWL